MSIVVRFRGALAYPDRIETFEDHLVEIAVELGGYARIWRSASDGSSTLAKANSPQRADPPRFVCGALLDLAPGLGTVPLLVSPEGVLMAFAAVDEAERQPLKQPAWIEVETSFAQADAHAVVAEFLLALKEKFAPALEVEDDAGYFPSRNLAKLLARRREKPVPAELESLQKRIYDATLIVRRCLLEPAPHAPVQFSETKDEDTDPTNFGTENEWIAAHKERVRREARTQRSIGTRALRDEIQELSSDVDLEGDETPSQFESVGHDAPDDSDAALVDEDDEDDLESGTDRTYLNLRRARRRRDPLMARTKALIVIVSKTPRRKDGGDPGTFLDQVAYGIQEAYEGLTQARRSHNYDKVQAHGLQLVQFIRALQGVNYARAALRPVLLSKELDKKTGTHLSKELAAVQAAFLDELSGVRARMKR